MKDTPPAVEALHRRMLLALPPEERLRLASDMFSFARECALAGIRAAGTTDPVEEQVQLFLRLHGKDFAPEARARVVAWIRAQRPPAAPR